MSDAGIARLLATLFEKYGYDFRDYSPAHDDSAIMDSALRKHVVWAKHYLVTDRDFG